MEEIVKLEWDTDFFEKNVFSLKTSSVDLIQKAFNTLPQNSLLYVFSNEEISIYKKFLFDRKVTFIVCLKKADPDLSFLNGVRFYSKAPISRKELIFLSLESSKHSRYRVDPEISNNKVDELYVKWIDKTICNLSNHEILAIERDGYVVGMIAIKMALDCHHVELIAVHPNYYRQGIAGKLIEACFQNALSKGILKVSVVTQLDNLEACGLYKKYGFKIDTVKYLYHLHK